MEICLVSPSSELISSFLRKYQERNSPAFGLTIKDIILGYNNPISMIRGLFGLEPEITVCRIPDNQKKYGSFITVKIQEKETIILETDFNFSSTDRFILDWCRNAGR
jgi:hypothetical protein